MEFFSSFDPRLIWFFLGILFFVLEVITPGTFLMFFGAGAWLTCLVYVISPVGAVAQWTVFTFSSVAFLLLFRKKIKFILKREAPDRQDMPDDPLIMGQYIGREVLVIKDLAPGTPGLVELNGTNWQAVAEESFMPGQRVKVAAMEGLTLRVVAVTDSNQ